VRLPEEGSYKKSRIKCSLSEIGFISTVQVPLMSFFDSLNDQAHLPLWSAPPEAGRQRNIYPPQADLSASGRAVR